MVLALGLLVGVGLGPASAHAGVDGSSPGLGQQLAAAPQRVQVHFDESVTINAGSLAVLDPSGRRVDAGRPEQPDGDLTTVAVRMPDRLPSGSYSVLWRVVSADGHPAAGSFAFGIGAPAGTALAEPAPAASTGLLHTIAWVTAYLGAVLLIGVPSFLLLVWPGGLRDRLPRALVRTGWGLSTGSAVTLFVLQAPFGAGLGPDAAADPGLVGQTLSGRVGLLLLARLFVLGLAVAAGPWPGTAPPSALRRDGAGLGLLFLGTFALAGHPGEGPLAPLTVVLDAAHLAAASVWLGGLALLLGRALTTAPAAGPPLDRWSRVATAAVCVIAATGTLQAWFELGGVDALVTTQYGHLVLAKSALVAVMLVVASRSRLLVRRARGNSLSVERLRRHLVTEAAFGVTVLVLTTVLVGTPAKVRSAPPDHRGIVHTGPQWRGPV